MTIIAVTARNKKSLANGGNDTTGGSMDNVARTLKQYGITRKMLRVLVLYAESDIPLRELADELSLAEQTVNQHMRTLRAKLGVKTNTAMVVKAHRIGLINLSGENSDTKNAAVTELLSLSADIVKACQFGQAIGEPSGKDVRDYRDSNNEILKRGINKTIVTLVTYHEYLDALTRGKKAGD